MEKIVWNYATMVGNDPATLAPIFYKEGCCGDSTITLPTGTDAADLGEGTLVRFTAGDKKNKVYTYSREADSWDVFVDFSA